MKAISIRVVLIGVFLVGLVIFCYPTLKGNYIDRTMKDKVEEFNDNTIEESSIEECTTESVQQPYKALYESMLEYNNTIRNEGQKGLCDPWAYEESSILLEDYGVKENIIGSISIPKMNVIMPIYLGATVENMKCGAVHLSQTSLPIGGQSNNSVIAAHRGYAGSAMFRHIEYLKEGDQVIIKNLWGELTYRVVEIKIIAPMDISEILIQENRDLVTLITCHPYTKNYQRYVVYCEREL